MKPFYFPFGKPSNTQTTTEKSVASLKLVFRELGGNVAKFKDFKLIMKACGLPLYWKAPFFNACGGKANGDVTLAACVATYERICSQYHDDASKLFHMLTKKGREGWLEVEDLEVLLKDIIHTHPGLHFLLDAPEFHSRYIVTVITRIFYVVNVAWNGRLTLQELRRSNLLQVFLISHKNIF